MLIIYIIALLIGLAAGWYIALAAYRIRVSKSVLSIETPGGFYPRCDMCGKKIRPYDLIPAVSFVVLGGRCRECGRTISPFYPICELCCAVLWLGASAVFGAAAFLPAAWVEISMLFFFLAAYIYAGRIPPLAHIFNFIFVLGWNAALFLAGIELYWDNLLGLLAGAAIFFFLAEVLKKDDEGLDINCMLIMTAFGMAEGIIALMLALFIGSIIGAAVLVPLRRTGYYRIKGALLPAMAAGCIAAVLVHPFLPI